MKKVIFILITFILSFLVFNSNVSAYNSDATATCYYVFPTANTSAADYYKSATVKYTGTATGASVTGSCAAVTSTKQYSVSDIIKGSCEIMVDYTAFINETTDKIECPKLYFYQVFDAGLGYREYTFRVMDPQSFQTFYATKNISTAEKKYERHILMTPTSSSVVNQGTKPITDIEKVKYMTCTCGNITLKRGSIYFNDKTADWNEKYTIEGVGGFSVNTITKCPDNLYYRIYTVGKTVELSDATFEPKRGSDSAIQTVACGDTWDLKEYYGSTTKNPTDYVPQEDVIKPFCEETAKIWKIVGYLVMALKIMVPAIIIVMGSIDLGKAVVAQSEDDIKKGTQLLIKRVIAGIIIFFIPTIVTIVLKMASKYSSTISSNSTCIECVSKPGSC